MRGSRLGGITAFARPRSSTARSTLPRSSRSSSRCLLRCCGRATLSCSTISRCTSSPPCTRQLNRPAPNLPPCSADFNPIAQDFAKQKAISPRRARVPSTTRRARADRDHALRHRHAELRAAPRLPRLYGVMKNAGVREALRTQGGVNAPAPERCMRQRRRAGCGANGCNLPHTTGVRSLPSAARRDRASRIATS